jgi:hypothetical protein
VILAYDMVCAQRIRDQIDSGTYKQAYKLEDEVAMKIYGKGFDQIKYELFKKGN